MKQNAIYGALSAILHATLTAKMFFNFEQR